MSNISIYNPLVSTTAAELSSFDLPSTVIVYFLSQLPFPKSMEIVFFPSTTIVITLPERVIIDQSDFDIFFMRH